MQGTEETPGREPFDRVLHEARFLANEEATRSALGALRQALVAQGQNEAMIARVEQAIAEVLNNIAEHAYAGRADGVVSLELRYGNGALRAEVRDDGRALPAALHTDPGLPRLDVSLASLPEGGFGWHLIHRSADNVVYERAKGKNRLSLIFFDGKRP